MNTRIACLLLLVITYAPASAAPKFPLKRHAAIEFFRNGKFAPGLGGVRIALTRSPDGKTLAGGGMQTKINDRGQKESVYQ